MKQSVFVSFLFLFLLKSKSDSDDDCPIRYDDGRNPWQVIDEFLFFYASASTNIPSFFLYAILIFLILNFP
jgi:hypothetical protein